MLKNLFIIKYITLLINKNQNNFKNNLEKLLYIQNIKNYSLMEIYFVMALQFLIIFSIFLISLNDFLKAE